jgi:hypothetical protein
MPQSPVNKRCFAIKPALATALITRGRRTGARSAGEDVYGAGPRRFTEDNADTGRHYLLTRRNDTTGEHAYLRCYSPRPVTLHALVTVAGSAGVSRNRFTPPKVSPDWTNNIPAPDLLASLDHLGHARHACLAVATATRRDTQPAPTGVIVLTVNEFPRLFDPLLLTTRHIINSLLTWSRWRRQHQYRAPLSHYHDAKTNDHELRLLY